MLQTTIQNKIKSSYLQHGVFLGRLHLPRSATREKKKKKTNLPRLLPRIVKVREHLVNNVTPHFQNLMAKESLVCSWTHNGRPSGPRICPRRRRCTKAWHPQRPRSIVARQCLIRSVTMESNKTLTSPSESVLCLMRISHAGFLPDTRHYPMVTSQFVCRMIVSDNGSRPYRGRQYL